MQPSLAPSDRILTLRPASIDELSSLFVNRSRGVLLIETKASFAEGDRVLLDVKLPAMKSAIVLRTRVTFTLPERRGPFFAVVREDLPKLNTLFDAPKGSARAHSRYAARIDARVEAGGRWMRAQVMDVSRGGARIAVLGELPAGANVRVEMVSGPRGVPARFSAVVRGESQGTFGLSLDGGGRALSRFVRRAEETGTIPRLD